MTRILVVEDSRTQAAAARAILLSAGHEVEVAEHGEEALRLVDLHRFDLVLSDIMMPGMSGYDLCRRIKSHARTRHLPVILLTTLNDPMDIIEGLEAGADNFITKPYEPQDLITRISTLLENKALRVGGKLELGVQIIFLGKKFNITSDKEQILDLLIATFEDIVRTNMNLKTTQAELASANAKVEEYARALEGRVRRSEEKYRNLMEQANDAILIIGGNGELHEANRQAEKLLGLTRDELEGRCVTDLLPIDASTPDRIVAENPVPQTAIEIVGSDGKIRALEYSISRTVVEGQELAFAIVRDVTEKKTLEQSIHTAQKLEAVARLASGAAHDFNNVLMGIMSFTQVLLRQIPEGHPARSAADQVLKASKRGSWLTKQLLAFTRSPRQAAASTDINAVLRDLAEMLRRLVPEEVEIVMKLDATRPVALEPGQIEQIAMNLVVNARDAIRGRGTIVVETSTLSPARALEAGFPARPHVVLSVRDSGVGMSAETAEKLFQPFFTTKESGRGTGLGLSIVETIVAESGGHIKVSSEIGKGSQFTIHLPAADPAENRRIGSETIVVIHRNESIRSVIVETLAARGYHVLHAGDARTVAGLERAELLILDPLQLPLAEDSSGVPVIRVGSLDPDDPTADGSGNHLNADELLVQVGELLDRKKAG